MFLIQLRYDKMSGISQFLIEWTAQSAANQRAGRAGRTSAGNNTTI